MPHISYNHGQNRYADIDCPGAEIYQIVGIVDISAELKNTIGTGVSTYADISARERWKLD